jgi:hypothetical protein
MLDAEKFADHTQVSSSLSTEHRSCGSQRGRTLEDSNWGPELLAMRIAIKMIEGLRCKLQMMGVPIPDECTVLCDNSAVVRNSQPESTLKKNHAAINFNRVREAIAAGTIKVAKEDTQSNLCSYLNKVDARSQDERIVRTPPLVTAAWGHCTGSRMDTVQKQ